MPQNEKNAQDTQNTYNQKPIASDVDAAHLVFVKKQRRLQDSASSRVSVWLITFTDAMALMLTFFVLLFSMQKPKAEYWQDFTTALYQGFNVFKGDVYNKGRVQDISLDALDLNSALALPYLKAILDRSLATSQNLDNVILSESKEGLLLSLPDKLLFQSGSANLSQDGEALVKSIASVFNRIKNQIIIRGHTDSRPLINQETYISNWGLSIDRALSVVQSLRTFGYQRPVITQGVAATHQRLMPDTMSEEQVQEVSRRVDILILDNDGTLIDEIF